MAAFDYGAKADPVLFEKPLNGGYHIDIQACLKEGWEMFKQHIGEFVGFTLIIFAVSAICSKMGAFGSIIVSAAAAPFYAGYGIAAFTLLNGKPFQFSDFFRGFNYFLPLFLAGLATGILVSLGFVLLVLPGIYLAVCYMFVALLVIDHRMEFWDAMETSRKVVSKNWFAVFGLAFALFAVNLLGMLALGIGLLVTAPVTACAAAVAYREIFGIHASEW
jgi:uncharacterized membrane protein